MQKKTLVARPYIWCHLSTELAVDPDSLLNIPIEVQLLPVEPKIISVTLNDEYDTPIYGTKNGQCPRKSLQDLYVRQHKARWYHRALNRFGPMILYCVQNTEKILCCSVDNGAFFISDVYSLREGRYLNQSAKSKIGRQMNIGTIKTKRTVMFETVPQLKEWLKIYYKVVLYNRQILFKVLDMTPQKIIDVGPGRAKHRCQTHHEKRDVFKDTDQEKFLTSIIKRISEREFTDKESFFHFFSVRLIDYCIKNNVQYPANRIQMADRVWELVIKNGI